MTIQAKYEAYWNCPKCNEPTYEDNSGVKNNDGKFDVKCNHLKIVGDNNPDDWENFSLETEKCNHEYTVMK